MYFSPAVHNSVADGCHRPSVFDYTIFLVNQAFNNHGDRITGIGDGYRLGQLFSMTGGVGNLCSIKTAPLHDPLGQDFFILK